ncbi:MAG TPA: hypothetical protein VMX36_05360 [Sedimentisphaerales bacterium]|nr:hypothetical protein [Sedimentisphaerales bacterium]
MNNKYTRFALAAAVYTAFAVYLYRPYFKGFDSLRLQDLFVANICLACLGAYVLSRRWVAGFAESFFAGAIYGFGPFALGLAKFHPSAGFLFAAIPWLFCPAVFGPEGKWKPLRVPLSLLPFLAIVLFFLLSARFGLYPIPIKLKLHGAEMAGLLAPLVAAKRNMTLVGFYHIPLASLIMGFSMLLVPLRLVFSRASSSLGMKTPLHPERSRRVSIIEGLAVRRLGIVAIFTVATILAFCDSFMDISPIIFLAISTLCCSVLIGAGMQGLISAGPADRRWVLLTAILLGILAIVTLLFATKYFQTAAGLGAGTGRLLTETAKMYILGAVAVAMLFVIARAKLRIHPVRQILLYATMALDIFLGARFIVDTIL